MTTTDPDRPLVEFAADRFAPSAKERWVLFVVAIATNRLKWPKSRVLALFDKIDGELVARGVLSAPGALVDLQTFAGTLYEQYAKSGFLAYKHIVEDETITAINQLVAEHPELKRKFAKKATAKVVQPTVPETGPTAVPVVATTATEGGSTEPVDAPPISDSERAALQAEVRAEGATLFTDIKAAVASHIHFDADWPVDLVALFVLQSWAAPVLPVVFYIFIAGKLGAAKTALMNLIGTLSDALVFENVSVAALARTIGQSRPAVTVCIDEFDVKREGEVGDVRDSIVRQGYRADAAPYTRWDPVNACAEEVPVYGPKVLTFRGSVDEALSSRGFTISSSAPEGSEHYPLVLRNLFRDVGDLPARLRVWGEKVSRAYTPADVRAIAYSDANLAMVREMATEIGANRESELMTVAALVAAISGVGVTPALKAAAERRRIELEAIEHRDIDQLRQAIVAVWNEAVMSGHTDDVLRVKQTVVRKHFDAIRKAARDYPVGDRQFARLRRDVGVRDDWLGTRGGKAVHWKLPVSFVLDCLNESVDEPPEGVQGGGPGWVTLGDKGDLPRHDGGVTQGHPRSPKGGSPKEGGVVAVERLLAGASDDGVAAILTAAHGYSETEAREEIARAKASIAEWGPAAKKADGGTP